MCRVVARVEIEVMAERWAGEEEVHLDKVYARNVAGNFEEINTNYGGARLRLLWTALDKNALERGEARCGVSKRSKDRMIRNRVFTV